jgi:DNA-binding winged helix-turn-helix (wHTH) protein/Tol biopolymer transport system component
MGVLARSKVRFGPFELDPQSGELFKLGHKLNLHGQPIQVLSILLDRPGELITREEFCQRLWPQDTFVDFEHSLNTAIKKLRQTLDDDPDAPRYIETLPRKGYRFIAALEVEVDATAAPADDHHESPQSLPGPKLRWIGKLLAAAVFLLIAAAVLYSIYRPRTPVVTSIHRLTSTAHQKGCSALVTDGTRVYFGEWFDGKSHLAQIATTGGEVSYIDAPLIQTPCITDISSDGSELLVADVSFNSMEVFNWIVLLPGGPARRIPGQFYWGTWFLPSSKRIVYTNPSDLRSLLTVNSDGSEARPLMSLPGETGSSVAVSPDGNRIRFATSDGKMWESRLDGTGLHRFLAEYKEPMCCGNWSRNGKLFVFASLDSHGYNLWGSTWSGWSPYRSDSRPAQLTNGPIQFQYSIPGPDGKQIFALGGTLRGELSVYDAKSNEFRPYLNGISAGFLDFSRDGQWVAYVTHPQGSLWRSRLDGTERLQHTFPPMGPILNPRWSPDGRFIAFTEWVPPNIKLYLVSADGGSVMLLLAGDFQPSDASWSPDGSSLVYGGQPP